MSRKRTVESIRSLSPVTVMTVDQDEVALHEAMQQEVDDVLVLESLRAPTYREILEQRIEDLVPPSPRMPQDRLQQRIRVLRDTCPKAPGSAAARNWALYVDGMMLSAYLAHPGVDGGRRRARRDVAHDEQKGYIRLVSSEEWERESGQKSGGSPDLESAPDPGLAPAQDRGSDRGPDLEADLGADHGPDCGPDLEAGHEREA